MEENLKVSYEQIEKANNEIYAMKIGNKDYATVNERVKAFRKVYPTGSIENKIEELRDDYVRISTIIRDENGDVIATGTASETKKGMVNGTSMLENCETSSVGRALGFAGFGIDNSIASGEDVERNKESMKRFEIFKDMFIKESEAITVVKNSINDLCRKMGLVKVELEQKVNEVIWTGLSDLNLSQCQKLENKLRTINMESNDWHELYNQNTKIKDVVPKNQEVVYESSWLKFGRIALQMAGTDESKRNEIIDDYLNMGIDLTKEV
jgi:hypothetical protein